MYNQTLERTHQRPLHQTEVGRYFGPPQKRGWAVTNITPLNINYKLDREAIGVLVHSVDNKLTTVREFAFKGLYCYLRQVKSTGLLSDRIRNHIG